MFRYLTPAKIGLLALIQLYVQDCVSAEATVPVLDFLTFHLLNDEHKREITSSAGRWRELDKTVQILTSINAFEQVLGALAAVDGLPGRRLWDQFLDKVWGINSLHTLYEFFDGVLQLLALSKDDLRELEERGEDLPTGIRLHHNSCLGLFVRRAHHEFSRLPFHDTTALWKALIKYRDSTKEYYQRRNPQHGRFSFDHVLLEGQHDWGENTDTLGKKLYGDVKHDSTLAVSVEDIEGVLEFQIGRLQSE